jgi:O-antigen/teichoic acid export membrane protein
MASEATGGIPTIDHKQHAAFFRQSGWLMIANIFAGMMTWGVHFLAKRIPGAEYSIFGAMLMLTACIPTMPLQMIFTQQTADALATNRERQLAGVIRLGWLWTFVLWAVAALGVLAFQGRIVERWQLAGPAALWVTFAVVLMNLWMPMFSGVLQGRQDFFWLGWASITGGAGRLAVALVVVLSFHGGATGMMAGAFIGIGAWAGIAIWRTRDLWSVRPERFDGRSLLKQVVPLMLGFGACQFLFTADTMFAKAYFSGDEMAPYVAAGTLSRALLWLVMPLATVMFPKIVHSSARSEKNNLLGIVLLGTAVLATCGALGLWLVGPWVVRLVYTPEYVKATTALLPWYAGAMVPLALANVLANDLLARSRFRVVPVMVLVTVAYGFTLNYMLRQFPGRLEVVLQTLGVFNLLLLGACAWFTWGVNKNAEVTDRG